MFQFGREPVWQSADGWHLKKAPAPLRHWLVDTHSLTKRLIDVSGGDFQVQVLQQGWQRPLHNERLALGLSAAEFSFIRQVYLLGRGQVWVYARSVIPRATLQGPLKALSRLGSRPLGAVLFANPAIDRGRLQIARIAPGQAMYNEATQLGRLTNTAIWGRRSLFQLHRHPLLVSEVFLPAILTSNQS